MTYTNACSACQVYQGATHAHCTVPPAIGHLYHRDVLLGHWKLVRPADSLQNFGVRVALLHLNLRLQHLPELGLHGGFVLENFNGGLQQESAQRM